MEQENLSSRSKGGIWVPMTDLFGVEGNLLLDMPDFSRWLSLNGTGGLASSRGDDGT